MGVVQESRFPRVGIRMSILRFSAVLMMAGCWATGAVAQTGFAPPDRPGPKLSVTQAQIDASLACSGNLADTAFEPVLLVPGTASTPQTAFSWNSERAFAAAGRP